MPEHPTVEFWRGLVKATDGLFDRLRARPGQVLLAWDEETQVWVPCRLERITMGECAAAVAAAVP